MKRQLNEYIIVPSQAFQTTWLALHSTEAIIEKKKVPTIPRRAMGSSNKFEMSQVYPVGRLVPKDLVWCGLFNYKLLWP